MHPGDGGASSRALLGDVHGTVEDGVLDDLNPVRVESEAELLTKDAADIAGNGGLVHPGSRSRRNVPRPPSASGVTSASVTPGTARSAATSSPLSMIVTRAPKRGPQEGGPV